MACGVFAALLTFARSLYTKDTNAVDKRVTIIFIILFAIDGLFFAYALISLVDANSPPMVVSLTPDKMTPQEDGTSIKWTATALDPEKDPVQYKFLLDGQQKTDWSFDSTWYWTTSNADIGSHAIEIKVKDGNHNVDGDDSKDIEFTISHQQNQFLTPATTGTPSVAPQRMAQVDQLSSEVVVFHDPKLDAAIRVAINKLQGTIYAADLEKIVNIYANNTGIKDINGLEYCTNLQTLDLFGSQITDVSSLAGLTNLKII